METELTDAEKAHQEALDSPRPIATVEDLEVASGHLHVLQRAIDMAKRRVADAASAVEKQRQLLIEAQTELRKFELWRDRGLQQQEEEASRVERKLTDDLAARTLRR
jgi:flagellar export protein FliJ